MYAEFLGQLEKSPSEGRLNLPEDLAESLIAKAGPPPFANSDMKSSHDLFNFVKEIGVAENEFSILFDLLDSLDGKERDETIKICTEIVESLPEEESRLFYNNKLKFFNDNPDHEKDAMDFISVIMSLVSRYFCIILFDGKRSVADDTNNLITSNILGIFLNSILSNISLITHKKTLAELKDNILKGDEESIFKAIRIDKNFLFINEVKEKIIKSQLSGDAKFFRKLGKAIADAPLELPQIHGKTFAILQLFWPYGLYRLTYQELYDFLIYCGLTLPNYPDGFNQFIHRNIKPLYNF